VKKTRTISEIEWKKSVERDQTKLQVCLLQTPPTLTPLALPAPAPTSDPSTDQNGFDRRKSNNLVGNPTLPNLICFLDFVMEVLVLDALWVAVLKVEAEADVAELPLAHVEVVGGAASPIVCADIPFYFGWGVSIQE
jgi:hypothetical protein